MSLRLLREQKGSFRLASGFVGLGLRVSGLGVCKGFSFGGLSFRRGVTKVKTYTDSLGTVETQALGDANPGS